MNIQTSRLQISDLQPEMAQRLHEISLDEANRRFVPDEVFETADVAAEVIADLTECIRTGEGPQVYAILLRDGALIGHVQAVPLAEGWEIGYHIGGEYAGCGYATEAVQAFLPVIMKQLSIQKMLGVCLADNHASRRVMEKSGFQKQYEGDGDYQGQIRPICKYQYE